MSNASTLSGNRQKLAGRASESWVQIDDETDRAITTAALADPDAQPITAEQVAASRAPATSKVIRHKLGMTRERFAAAYGIPLEVLTAWERHEAEPSPAETAYLELIAREPELSKRVVPAT